MKQNLVSFSLTDESFSALKQKLAEVGEKIDEFALELHITDKNTLKAMGNRSLPFTEYAYMMASQRKDLIPSYMDMEEFNKDMILFKQSRELLQMVEIIRERLIDTSTASGADAFSTARKFYTAVKGAVKSEIPGSTVIYDEMRKRFIRMSSKPEANPELKTQDEKKETLTDVKES